MGNVDTKLITRTECQAVREQLMKELESKGSISDNAVILAKNTATHTTIRIIVKWIIGALLAYLGVNSIGMEFGQMIAGWL